MSKRNQIHVEIESLTQKLSATNELLSNSNDLSMLDIDLLRKNTIEIYDLVNNLRLVMHESIPQAEKAIIPSQNNFEQEEKERIDNELKRKAEAEAEEARLKAETEEKNRKAEELKLQAEAEEKAAEEQRLKIEAEEKAAEELKLQAEAEEKKAEELRIKEEEEEESKNASDNESKEDLAIDKNSIADDSVTAEIDNDFSASLSNVTLEEPELDEPIQQNEISSPSPETKETQISINDNQGTEESQDLAGKFSATPINDLKKAISIAKKFEFINTLFQGNVEKYAYSIHFLNGLNSGDEAFEELNKLRVELEWEEEDRNYMELANLVRRRYLG